MLSWNEIIVRLAIASLLGALIGLERERKDWAAGLRTHMLVCTGSCLIMLVSAFGFADVLSTDHVTLDPSRIAAQVVSGIGFIGAGAILFSKQGTVRGLTTAAGLWTVAAIGLATGGGLYFAAGATTVIALIILWALQPLEQRYSNKFRHKILRIVASHDISNINLLKNLLGNEALKVQAFHLEREEDAFVFQLTFEHRDAPTVDALISELKKEPAVKEISWMQ